jgi:hypothetical protein
MSFSGARKAGALRALRDAIAGIVFNPLLIAAGLGVGAAAVQFEPPVALDRLLQFLYVSAAPCALFALGVTVALRPLEGVPTEVPLLVGIKLLVHPAIVLMLLPWFGSNNAFPQLSPSFPIIPKLLCCHHKTTLGNRRAFPVMACSMLTGCLHRKRCQPEECRAEDHQAMARRAQEA